jgi:urea carboxylase
MIKQGISERAGGRLLPDILDQPRYGTLSGDIHAIEARVYAENPAANFKPSPGVLQFVKFPEKTWLRLENWVRIAISA